MFSTLELARVLNNYIAIIKTFWKIFPVLLVSSRHFDSGVKSWKTCEVLDQRTMVTLDSLVANNRFHTFDSIQYCLRETKPFRTHDLWCYKHIYWRGAVFALSFPFNIAYGEAKSFRTHDLWYYKHISEEGAKRALLRKFSIAGYKHFLTAFFPKLCFLL